MSAIKPWKTGKLALVSNLGKSDSSVAPPLAAFNAYPSILRLCCFKSICSRTNSACIMTPTACLLRSALSESILLVLLCCANAVAQAVTMPVAATVRSVSIKLIPLISKSSPRPRCSSWQVPQALHRHAPGRCMVDREAEPVQPGVNASGGDPNCAALAVRNVSTTLIQPGSAFRLDSVTAATGRRTAVGGSRLWPLPASYSRFG
jgi:hypothetical protein